MGPVRAAWGRGKVAWGGVGLSRVEYHGTDAQASLGRVGPVRAAWGRGKVAWGGVGLSRVEYHGTDAEASLTSGRRPSGVGGYTHTHMLSCLSRSTQSCAALAKVGAEVWKALEAVYRLCLGSWSSRFSADETMPASSSHASPMNPSRFKWPESSETSGSVTHRNGSSDQATCAVEISSGPTLDGKRKCTHGEAYPLLRVSDQWAEVFLRHGEERRREALSTTLSGLHGHPRSRERTPSRTRRGVRLHNLPSGQTR